MTTTAEIAPHVRAFLYQYQYENWLGINEQHRPVSAKTRRGVLAFVRMCVPELAGVRDARLTHAIALAGYRVSESRSGGFHVEKCSTPAQQPGDDPRGEATTPAAAASA